MRGEVVFSLPTRRPFGLAQAGTSVADERGQTVRGDNQVKPLMIYLI